jgi:prepilin-type N-terminal cleavage/methylation domain-containing protein
MSSRNRTERGRSRGPDAGRGGFSLIELLMAISIVGILVGLAIPNLQTMTFRARATSVAADLDVIRVSALNFNADRSAWPAEAGPGVVPPGLVAFLPEGFSFEREGYQLDYENLSFPGGLPGDPTTTQLIGAAVTAPDDRLSRAIVEILGGSIVASAGNTHTVVIDRS